MTIFYVASKVIHADKWIKLREEGWPINSSWIDFGSANTITDWSTHWDKCISEASSADFCLAYCEEGEVLKGALCEIGAALASKKRVLFVGNYPYIMEKRYNVMDHPLITKFHTLDEALAVIDAHIAEHNLIENLRNF